VHEIVVNPYARKDSGLRRGLMVRGHWSDDCANTIRREGITALYLNSAKGWCDNDVSFLRSIPQIEELAISTSALSGLESLEALANLRELEITCSTRSQVDFTRLVHLERVYLYWWKGAESLFGCSNLSRVYLDKVAGFPPAWTDKWSSVLDLTIANSRLLDLDAVSGLTQLEKLELHNLRQLTDFTPIARLQRLRWLSIRGCKGLASLDFVDRLRSLEVLLLDEGGSIPTLAPLSGVASLKALSFTGSTSVEDGDLGVLEHLPRLGMLAFAPRHHYTHRLVKKWAWSNLEQPDKLLVPAHIRTDKPTSAP
jgi:hypothetical protein